MNKALEALEELIRLAEGMPKGTLHEPHICCDDVNCDCTSILAENGYMGGVCTMCIGNDLPVGEGGNDAPTKEEAAAYARFFVKAGNSLELFKELKQAIEWQPIETIKGNRRVLVSYNTLQGKVVKEAFYDEGVFFFIGGSGQVYLKGLHTPTHWKPLPEPPEE